MVLGSNARLKDLVENGQNSFEEVKMIAIDGGNPMTEDPDFRFSDDYIPVQFKNNNDSPGLKRGGVLNIVRRKVELKCPADNIPEDIIIDLTGTDIGTSIKISSVKLPENVIPVISDRDFVIATVAAPTVIKEPEKPAEETPADGAEGEAPTEGAEAAAKEGDAAKKDDKAKDGASDKKPEEKKSAEKKPAEKK